MREHDIMLRIREIDSLPYGSARVAAAEKIVKDVDEHSLDKVLVYALQQLIESYTFSDEEEKSFPVFARLLRLWDTKPELFDRYDRNTLFWQYKWLADELANFPEITKTQAEAFLSDMERRYQLEGNGLQAPLIARFQYAYATGDPSAEEKRLAWLAAPEDDFNDCAACVIGTQVTYFAAQGKWEEALEMGKTQRDSCNVEPCKTYHVLALAEMMLAKPLAAAHYIQLAKASYAVSYGNSFQSIRGWVLEALARGGAAKEFFKELAALDLTKLNGPRLKLDMLSMRLMLISSLTALLQGGVSPHTPTGINQPEYATAGKMLDKLVPEAKQMAAAFDKRNGNSYFADKLQEALTATPAAQPLPDMAEYAAAIEKATDTDAALSDNVSETATSTAQGDSEITAAAMATAAAVKQLETKEENPEEFFTRQFNALEHLAAGFPANGVSPTDIADAYEKLAELENDSSAALLAEAARWNLVATKSAAALDLLNRALEIAAANQGLVAELTHGIIAYRAFALPQFTVAAQQTSIAELIAACEQEFAGASIDSYAPEAIELYHRINLLPLLLEPVLIDAKTAANSADGENSIATAVTSTVDYATAAQKIDAYVQHHTQALTKLLQQLRTAGQTQNADELNHVLSQIREYIAFG